MPTEWYTVVLVSPEYACREQYGERHETHHVMGHSVQHAIGTAQSLSLGALPLEDSPHGCTKADWRPCFVARGMYDNLLNEFGE